MMNALIIVQPHPPMQTKFPVSCSLLPDPRSLPVILSAAKDLVGWKGKIVTLYTAYHLVQDDKLKLV